MRTSEYTMLLKAIQRLCQGLFERSKWLRRAAICLAIAGADRLPAQTGTGGTGTSAQPSGWLANQGSPIAPGDLPSHLAVALQQTGAR